MSAVTPGLCEISAKPSNYQITYYQPIYSFLLYSF